MKGIECYNVTEVQYVINKLFHQNDIELVREIDIAANEVGYPVIITEGGYYYFIETDEEVEVLNLKDFIKSIYPNCKHVFIYDSYIDYLKELDGKIYAIYNANGTSICDILEDSYINLLNKGIINENNHVTHEYYKETVLNEEVKIIIWRDIKMSSNKTDINKEYLIEIISGMIGNLTTMKEHLEKEEYQYAYEYADGIVNDSEELRTSLEK